MSPPEYLYKYRPINIHTIRTILQNEAYFSSPLDFNDPFDCKSNTYIDFTQDEMRTFVLSLMDPLPPNTEKNVDKYLTDNWANELLSREIDKTRVKQLLDFGVYCLSEVNDDIQMFSHYADGHKGLCLEFRFTNDYFFTLTMPIEYGTIFPKITIKEFRNPNEKTLKTWLAYKSAIWAREKERRIVKLGKARQVVTFPEELLVGIVFACESSTEDRRLIESLAKKRTHPLKLYLARKHRREFRLTIEELT